MMLSEFKKRVEKFVPADEIERYADDFEPAYMAAGTVDKDDFCSVLKDERVRKIMAALSRELTRRAEQIKADGEEIAHVKKEAAGLESAHEERLAMEEGKVEVLTKQLSLIQSVCDRALAPIG